MSKKADRYERTRIECISEPDFWSAWKAQPAALGEACRLGRAGRSEDAYLKLASVHRATTEIEWRSAIDEARQRNAGAKASRDTREKASNVMRGRITGWHSHVLDFGKRIDFNANFGQSGQYGFHYLGWFTPLIDRYILERDPKDLARIVEIVQQYYDQRLSIVRRIPRLHPVYYELGAWAKTKALLPAYLALIHTGEPSSRTVEAFLKLFLGFGRSLMRLQDTGYRAGNWQIVGAAGLFRQGATFPHLREAATWRRRALTIQKMHLDRDFFSDGCHKERCWSYGWMSLRGVLDAYETGLRNGLLTKRDSRTFLKVIRRAFAWFVDTVAPGDLLCAYGDGDLAQGAPVLEAGKEYVPDLEERKQARTSVCFRPSGYAVMRDNGSNDGRYLNVNFGPFGGWHTHSDLLDFNAWAFGQPIIEEVGRFDSYDQPLNPFFRSPEAHNQVVIEQHPMLRHETTGQGVRWFQSAAVDYFSAWHDAFRHPRSNQPVAKIHRHILFVRGAYWMIYDVVEPVDETIFTLSSYLHSTRRFKRTGPGSALVTGRVGAVIDFAFKEEIKRLETGADVTRDEVTAKRLFTERHFLRVRKWAPIGYRGNLRYAMVIYPFKGKKPSAVVKPIEMRGSEPGVAEAFEVRTPAGRDLVVFNPWRKKGLKLGRRAVKTRAMWLRGSKSVDVP